MANTWKRMSSGRYIDLVNLCAEDLDITDVNTSLNNIVRFTGHHKNNKPLTVAQHSLLCLSFAEILEPNDKDLHRAILTHDFAEAYIGDVAFPVKQAMGDSWYSFAKPIEQKVEEVFYGGVMSPEMHRRVKNYDLASLEAEKRSMWNNLTRSKEGLISPINLGILSEKLRASVARKEVDLESIWRKLL